MRSAWRVACVRIPRFPIGALWRARQHVEATWPAFPSAFSTAFPSVRPEDRPTPLPTPSAAPSAAPSGAPESRPPQLLLPLALPTPLVAPSPGVGGAAAPSRVSGGGEPLPPVGAAGAHWDEQLLALADGDAAPGGRLRVVSAAAGRRGVRAGMTVAAARARCAELVVWPWDDVALGAAVDAVTALFLVASPQVTPVAGAPGLWWVGAAGVDGVGGERGLARALHRLARGWHPRARVGVADSCVAARAATWHHARGAAPSDPGAPPTSADDAALVLLVPPGGCAAYLATVPLALVPMDDEVRAGLAALGLGVAGGLASLAPGDVEARWGAAGLAAWHLARGDDRRRPGLVRVEARRSVSTELAAPTTTLEPVLFLVRAALDRLAGELAGDGVGAATVALTLALDVGATRTVTREVRLPRPLARSRPLFERCRALLERVALPAPVCGVTVAITATGRLGGDQGDLLAQGWHDPAAAEAAFARIRAELGPNVVVRPVARDAHPPERAGAWLPAESVALPAPTPSPDTPASPLTTPLAPLATLATLRLLTPPEPADVTPDAPDTPPRAIHWRGRSHPVAHADGPERLAGEWWSEPYRRDYWRCAIDDGELLLLYRERVGGLWYVQGWSD